MLQFEVIGTPVPQKQTRFAVRGGKPMAYDPSKKDLEYIRWQIRPYAPLEPIQGPISISITFLLPAPKSTSRARRRQMHDRILLPVVKPDLDNLAYLVTNALKTIIYNDDNQICESHYYKYYGDTAKTIIQVRKIETCAHYSLGEPS